MLLTQLTEAKIKSMNAEESFKHWMKMKKMFDAGVGNITQATLDKLKQNADDALALEVSKGESALKTKHGDEWFALAQKMYPITKDDAGFTVTSKVRNWKGEKRLDGTGSPWQFSDENEAKWKVIKLVKWLEQNRNRDIGDADSDIAKWNEKLDQVDKAKHV